MKLKTFSLRVLEAAPQICPFLLGPLFFSFNREIILDPTVSASYVLFFGLFLAWYGVKRSAFELIERKAAQKAQPSAKDKLLLVALAVTSGLTLVFLELMRLRLQYEVFAGVLAVVGLGALRLSLEKKKLTNWAQLVSLLYLTGVGSISIFLGMAVLSWQPVYIGLGLACMVLAAEILAAIEREQLPMSAARSVPYLLTCGPTFIAALSYMHELPRSFLAIFVTLIPSTRIITAIKNAQSSSSLSMRTWHAASGICLLFVGIIAVASYLYI